MITASSSISEGGRDPFEREYALRDPRPDEKRRADHIHAFAHTHNVKVCRCGRVKITDRR